MSPTRLYWWPAVVFSREDVVAWGTLAVILGSAAFFRLFGLAWDSGYLFHPDERQIILVISRLEWPSSILSVFSPSSPLNPHFFAYGSFPIYLLKVLSPLAAPIAIVGPWQDDMLARIAILGRFLSGTFDLATIVITFLVGRRLYGVGVGLVAAACVAVTVLHIQLSHFYTVDTLLTFFVMATLYSSLRMVQENNFFWKGMTGVTWGLALATKISALPLMIPVAYACSYASGVKTTADPTRRWLTAACFDCRDLQSAWRTLKRPLAQIGVVALGVFLVTQPYALIDWFAFGRDVVRESLVARGWLDFPYTRQYAGTIPFVYQIGQSTIWGMGLPLGVLAWSGGGLFLYGWWKQRRWQDTLLLSWVLVYFILIGMQYAKYLRYLLPLLPSLYIMAACGWGRATAGRPVASTVGRFALVLALGSALVYATAFIRIYAREHPWLTASRWLYENVPTEARLAVEQWDDALPVLIEFPRGTRRGGEYRSVVLPLYDDDSEEKGTALAQALANTDVIIVASQRLYGSIGRLPRRYPLTTRYYQKLFNGELGFVPVFTARNDPNLFGVTVRDDPRAGLGLDLASLEKLEQQFIGLPNGRIWNWGLADESFSVYDHPQPIIFKKAVQLDAQEILRRLQLWRVQN